MKMMLFREKLDFGGETDFRDERGMEIINELEPSGRGLYSGSFGYIGFCRQLDFNILIRTIFIKNGEASFHVGAGIVADSDPDNEYEETLSKAAAMIEVLSDPTC